MKNKRPDQFDILDHQAELSIHLEGKKRIIIIEGVSDRKFLNYLLTKTKEKIETFCMGFTESKNCKEDIIELFESFKEIQNNPSVMGIIDKDHSVINPKFSNLIQTEFADIDCYYFNFSSFNNFLIEFLDKKEIEGLLGYKPSSNLTKFRHFVYDSLLVLTKMRGLNKKYNVPFNKILNKSTEKEKKDRHKKIKKFLAADCTVELDIACNYLASNSVFVDIDIDEYKQDIKSYSPQSIAMFTNGHDIVSFLACLCNLVNGQKLDDLQVEQALRLSIHQTCFLEFEFTRTIYTWIFGSSGEATQEVATGVV